MGCSVYTGAFFRSNRTPTDRAAWSQEKEVLGYPLTNGRTGPRAGRRPARAVERGRLRENQGCLACHGGDAGAATQQTSAVLDEAEGSGKAATQPDISAPPPAGHGHNGAEAFGGARQVEIAHQAVGDELTERLIRLAAEQDSVFYGWGTSV